MKQKPVCDLIGFFKPKSIALIGVSRGASAFGGLSFMRRLLDAGYKGAVYPINPKAVEVLGIKTYPDLAALPEIPELVTVCVQAAYVPAILKECVRLSIRHIHILSAGFSEIGTEEGKNLEKEIASIAREGNLLIMGPNCMGPYCPSAGLTAWGAIPGLNGRLGVISQSGGITQRLTEHVTSLGVGVSKAASIGNATIIDSPEYLEFMGEDKEIDLIAMYLESVRDGRRLMRISGNISPCKPVIMLKGGRSEEGAITAASHTGGMAGDVKLWNAFFSQTGVIPVKNINEWADAVLAFSLLPKTEGNGLFIVGGGGGNSVIYSDAVMEEGLEVPALSQTSMDKIRSFVPVAGSIAGNPLDLWESFVNTDRLCEILDIAYKDPEIHMVVVDRLIPRIAFHSPEIDDPIPQIANFIGSHTQKKPTVFVVDYDGGDPELNAKGSALRTRFCLSGIPAYPSFERAARALVHFQKYYLRFKAKDRM
ncbi:MAG: CoA-binding protein [Syntrophales bacterium]|jgi:acyl-CoA synthetase (NDP forming)|nr:CoA-binding protein [Syntrophales bacterium]MDY0043562.1 CoA-binding protein [Syntrophales bacterium]